ncbi:Mo25-like protein [Viridothelium virens]|uniref:Mo25-like protein n=1 Tax=Viridothelium virens TaxID=1048519 RepID=A0A6A6HPQ6_VIRVR|nr:Mo25-like protein [Viridothelium virens]
MAFLFARNKQKSGVDLVKTTSELMQKLDSEDKASPKAEEEIARNLTQMKITLQGTPEAEVNPDQVQHLVTYLIQDDLLHLLVTNLHKLPFESRKDTQVIISNIFRYQAPGSTSTEPVALSHICYRKPEIILALCHGYDRRESFMACGGVLREALKRDAVAAIILYHEPDQTLDLSNIDPSTPASGKGVFWKFFYWIDKGAFELSADAFNTFREILTRNKEIIAMFIQTNFDLFFQKYNAVLVQSDSYVTKRQSIKLLGELLLDRANYSIMCAYVDSGDNLKLCMNLLRDDRKMVSYEGFHIFKVFVANPNKSAAVHRILYNNKDRILRFLPNFLHDRKEDDQFNDEKTYLVKSIDQLGPPSDVPQASKNGAA